MARWSKSAKVANGCVLSGLATIGILGILELGSEDGPSGSLARAAFEAHRDDHSVVSEPSPGSSGAGEVEVGAWSPGTHRAYEAEFGTQIDSRGEKSTLQGTMEISYTVVEHSESRTLAAGVLLYSEPLRSGDGENSTLGTSRGDVEFAFEIDDRGAIGRVWLDPEIDAFSQAITRQAVSGLQFVRLRGIDEGENSWRVLETDHHGTYSAIYEQLADDSVLKTKREYRDTVMQAKGLPSPSVRFSGIYRVLGGSLVVSADIEEEMAGDIGYGSFAAKSRLRIRLSSSGYARPTRPDFSRLVASPLSAFLEPTGGSGATRGSLPAEVTLDALIALLDQEGMDAETSWQIHATLVQLFSERPAEILAALDRARSADDIEMARALVAAVGDADSMEAQAALVDFVRDPQAKMTIRETGLIHLALSNDPTEDTLYALSTMGVDPEIEEALRPLALRAAGGAVRNVDGNSAIGVVAAADDVVEFLAGSAATAVDASARSDYIDALGNTGSPVNLRTSAQHLQDPESEVRMSAVDALRFVADPLAAELIVGAMRQDSDPQVRRMAVHTWLYRDWDDDTVAALDAVIAKDTNASVREEAVMVLGKEGNDPRVREILDRIAENDASTRMREQARRILDQTRDSLGEGQH